MSNIESVSNETRVFEPPAGIRRAGERQDGRLRRAQCRAPRRTSRASGRSSRATRSLWHKPFTRTLDESNAPFYKWFDDGELNVSYNCLDRNLANGNADKVAIIFEADDGTVTQGHLPGALSARLPLRERAEVARHQEGRPRARSTCRCRSKAWSRCRPARASARRTRWCSAASPRSRCRSASSTPARSRSSPPTSRCAAARQLAAEDDRRRGARDGRLRGHPQRDRLPAHRRQRSPFNGAARPLVARARREAGRHLRAEVGRRRASAVHPLHVGLDRQAEGRAAQLPAATCCGRC